MCDEAVDDSLAALKLILDWFVTSEMIKNFLLLFMQISIKYGGFEASCWWVSP